MSAEYWIEKLDLLPHPEGGCYREVYRCSESCDACSLPVRFGAGRAFSTAIYFLLKAGGFSAFHRIKSDEIWHHYDGGDLQILVIHPNGRLECGLLGKQQSEARPMIVVPHGAWFAARLCPGHDFVLCGCTVAPGFDFSDFEMASGSELVREYPQHAGVIGQLTRSGNPSTPP